MRPFTLLFLLLALGCSAPPPTSGVTDASRFNDAAFLGDDDRYVLITARHASFRLVADGLGDRRASYERDRKSITLFDSEANKAVLLWSEERAPGGDGRGNLRIVDTAGRRALLFREPSLAGEEARAGAYLLIDSVPQAIMAEPLELGLELQGRQLRLSSEPELVLPDGTLLLRTQPADIPEGSAGTDDALWLRLPSGIYERLVTRGRFSFGFDGQIYYEDLSEGLEQMAYDPKTNTRRKVEAAEDIEIREQLDGPLRRLEVSVDGKRISIRERKDGSWVERPIPVKVEDLP